MKDLAVPLFGGRWEADHECLRTSTSQALAHFETENDLPVGYVQNVCVPIALLLIDRLPAQGPQIVGIVGGPGAGKTSLGDGISLAIDALLDSSEACVRISLEDFYFDVDARRMRGIRWRATPGSHDTSRLNEVVNMIRSASSVFELPRFDMSRDQPMPPEVVQGPVRIAIFEGWLVGSEIDDYMALTASLSFLIYMDGSEHDLKRWRFARERLLNERGLGMSPSAMEAFWQDVLGPGIRDWVVPIRRSANLVLDIGSSHVIERAYLK